MLDGSAHLWNDSKVRPFPLALILAGCSGSSVRPHPEEVPIAQFSASPISREEAPVSTTSAPGDTKSDAKGDGKGPIETNKSEPPPKKAEGLDSLEAAFGGKFGTDEKNVGKVKSTERAGDRTVFQAIDKRRDFGTVASPIFSFYKEKLGTVGIRVKTAKECKTLRAALDKKFAAPADGAKGKGNESAVWKGESVGVRLSVDPKGCSGLFVHKDFSRDQDWASLEP